ATLARSLAGEQARGVIPVPGANSAALELARFLPRVTLISRAHAAGTPSERAAIVAHELRDADVVLVPASPDGRDLAGALAALTGLGVLANATGVSLGGRGLEVTQTVFGGKLVTKSSFKANRGIVTLGPNSAT